MGFVYRVGASTGGLDVISVILNESSSEPINASIPLIIAYFFMGFFVSLTQLVPGLSCSALLMAFGQFGAILASVHLDYLLENPMVIVAIGSLGVGFVCPELLFQQILVFMYLLSKVHPLPAAANFGQ